MRTPRTDFRSKRLARLFAETWERLPAKDRRVIAERVTLISDNRAFCPLGYEDYIGLVDGVRGLKRCSVYLNARRLARRKLDYVRASIAHELAHVFCGHDGTEDQFSDGQAENEAQERVSIWGFEPVRIEALP